MVSADYEGQKASSYQCFQLAKQYIPGGVTANIKYFSPHPIFMKAAKGSKLIDVDNQEYIDYSLSYGALITGHGHEAVIQATLDQLHRSGTMLFGTPHDLEVAMAKKINELYPSMEQLRFTNSGTEAVLLAIRLARAYTGKERIAKFEGHYHGGLNEVLVSINPTEEQAGRRQEPKPVYESNGIPIGQQNTLILPFNDLAATERLLRQHGQEIAAVILEPIQGGFIPPEPSFIQGLRQVTEELNILLIFDEVKTGFRVDLGGAQSLYQILPDLTTLGKVLGGGLPIGAVGGKKEMMSLCAVSGQADVFALASDSSETSKVVFHSGTYNGHPLVLAAGIATIQLLEEADRLEKAIEHTELLKEGLTQLYAAYQIPMQTLGEGTIFNMVISHESITSYRDLWKQDQAFRQAIDVELLKRGIYLKPLNRYSLSIVHTEQDRLDTIRAHEEAIQAVLARTGEASDLKGS